MELNTTNTLLALGFALALFAWARRFYSTYLIEDFERGLLIRRGRLVRELGTGVYGFFGRYVDVEITDLRSQSLKLATQEVATQDDVPVKVNVQLNYRVVSPATARAASSAAEIDLYQCAQVSLRGAVLEYTLEDLSQKRAELGRRLTEELEPQAQRLGLTVESVALLDVIVRSEIKRALGEVVQARAEARAKLERARGESAALRNLANAARLLKENEGLYQLRLLETAQSAATSQANSLVLGLREGLEFTNGRASARPE